MYPVTLAATNSNGTDTLIKNCYISVVPWFGIQQIGNEIPDKFSLSQNYPNPFNPITHFEFRIADFEFVLLIVYDIRGREIATLVRQQLQAGIYEVDWDASNYPSGVYFYTLSAKDFTETKRMVLIK